MSLSEILACELGSIQVDGFVCPQLVPILVNLLLVAVRAILSVLSMPRTGDTL